MSTKKLDRFVEDFEAIETTYPKWIDPFREKYYKDHILPILIIYHAVGINRSLKNKGQAIATATKYAQENEYVHPDSNSLTLNGEVREIAIMKRLGKRKLLTYLEQI